LCIDKKTNIRMIRAGWTRPVERKTTTSDFNLGRKHFLRAQLKQRPGGLSRLCQSASLQKSGSRGAGRASIKGRRKGSLLSCVNHGVTIRILGLPTPREGKKVLGCSKRKGGGGGRDLLTHKGVGAHDKCLCLLLPEKERGP